MLPFLLTPLREGRRTAKVRGQLWQKFLLTPLREGRRRSAGRSRSRTKFLLTPLREGRRCPEKRCGAKHTFLLTPLREGRPDWLMEIFPIRNFYSRPCGRGDCNQRGAVGIRRLISTHAPAGGATFHTTARVRHTAIFLLTPLREGRRHTGSSTERRFIHFYSRPCGRGDQISTSRSCSISSNFYSRPCGRGDMRR